MDIFVKALIIIALAALVICIIYVAICAVWFVLQEINHSFKNAKRTIKKALWDIEWKLTH